VNGCHVCSLADGPALFFPPTELEETVDLGSVVACAWQTRANRAQLRLVARVIGAKRN
jgi:hypothetical protein